LFIFAEMRTDRHQQIILKHTDVIQ
jgi:hypothetical protein